MPWQHALLFQHYPEARFGGFTQVDGTVAFYVRVHSLIGPDSIVLDIGCGRGAFAEDPVHFRRDLRVLRGRVARVIGTDIDEAAAANPFLDEFRPMHMGAWDVEDASVDVAIADFVLEHVADPAAVLAQAGRVVRPGGYLCIRTTNLLSYVGLASSLTPNSLHPKLLKLMQLDRKEHDVFRTVYRCNTRRRLRRALRAAGFEGTVFGFHSEPWYLSRTPLLYRMGVLLQRILPHALAPTLFAFAQRRSAAMPSEALPRPGSGP